MSARPTPEPGERSTPNGAKGFAARLASQAVRLLPDLFPRFGPCLALGLMACASAKAPEPSAPEPTTAEHAPTPAEPAAGARPTQTQPSSETGASQPAPPTEAPTPGEHLVAAVDSPDRPAEDRARDADRLPARVLAFFGIEPGMKVVDLMAGKGYYTEILSRAVGPRGRVLSQNNAFVLNRFARGPLSERLARPGLENAVLLDQELDGLDLEPGSLDAAVMVLFYHDTVWQGVDRAEMNRRIFAALEPGGVFGVVDHRAQADSGTRDAETLHRIDENLVAAEVQAAGFELEATSDVLFHPEDDRTKNVFAEGMRGKTDRFAYRFRKP